MSPTRILFIITQTLTLIIGFLGLGITFISIFTDFNAFVDFVPVELIQATGVISVTVVFVSFVGMMMVLCRFDSCFVAFVLLSFIQIVVNLGFLIVLSLFRNGQETLPGLDRILNETINNFEANNVVIALEDPDVFQDAQNLLDCCGISMEVRFIENASTELIFTGDRCFDEVEENGEIVTGIEVMDEIVLENDNLEDALAAADATDILNDDDFFCEEDLEELVDESLALTQGVMIVILIFETISFLCSFMIFCCVSRGEDGKLDFENGADRPNEVIVKVTKNVQAPFKATFARFNTSEHGSYSFRGYRKQKSFDLDNSEVDSEVKEENAEKAKVRFTQGGGAFASAGIMSMIAPFRSKKKLKRLNTPEVKEDEVNSEVETTPPNEEELEF